MEKQSPVQRIWELGKDEHGKLITAVILAEKTKSKRNNFAR